MYLTAKDIIKSKPQSIFEIGYILFGRGMIYFNGLMLMLLGLGLDIIYYIVAGKIMKSVVRDLAELNDSPLSENSIFNGKSLYIVILSVIHSYWFFKK